MLTTYRKSHPEDCVTLDVADPDFKGNTKGNDREAIPECLCSLWLRDREATFRGETMCGLSPVHRLYCGPKGQFVTLDLSLRPQVPL